MTRLLGIVLIVSLAIGANVQDTHAVPGTPAMHVLEHRLAHSENRVKQLEKRRAFLHRYIKGLRLKLHPEPSVHETFASGGWGDELRAVGFPESAIPHMLYIIQRESGGDPNAVNASSGACGLTQLFPCYGGSAWLDPITNLRLALQKYRAAGFQPWGG